MINIKETLLNLIDDNSPETVNMFSNYPVTVSGARYIWKTIPEGVLLYSTNEKVLFFSTDGCVHKITTSFTDRDWKNHNELYKLADSRIRMDTPVFQEYLGHKNKHYSYSIIQRPNKQHGKTFWHYLVEGTVDRDFILRYIDDTTTLLSVLKTMDCLIPVVGFSPDKQMKDDLGFFWGDFKVWDRSFDYCIEKTLTVFSEYLYILDIFKNSKEFFDLRKLAEEKWKTI